MGREVTRSPPAHRRLLRPWHAMFGGRYRWPGLSCCLAYRSASEREAKLLCVVQHAAEMMLPEIGAQRCRAIQ